MVLSFKGQGFTVEYEKTKILIMQYYIFLKDRTLELLGDVKFPSILEFSLRLFGKALLVNRIRHYHYAKEGLLDVCLENYKTNLNTEKNILKKNKQQFFEKNSNTRIDTKNRKLKCKVVFPYEKKLPFLMTYFTIDPKPKNHIHKNDVKKIKSISFGIDKKCIPLIEELCDDKTLQLFIGDWGARSSI